LPLITTETGEKFGKSEGNALFLDPSMTSPYHIFQYCYNLSDKVISALLHRLTFLSEEAITVLCQASPELRKPQIALGYELLSVISSEEMAKTAVRLSELLFSRSYSQLSAKEIALLKTSITVHFLHSSDLNTDIATIISKLGAAESKTAVRKLISQRALRVNGEIVENLEYKLEGKAVAERFFVVQSGKKHMELLELRD
jgi:tyrosyl-tRNA synthetase